MTWEHLIWFATLRLDEAGVAEPRLNAEYLAAHVLRLSRKSELRALLDDRIRYEHAVTFSQLLFRREHREPLQYVLGEWEFYGLPIKLNRSVLIPRPETEILVEEAQKEAVLLGDQLDILDIGTGSGAIALALASLLPHAHILGNDISRDALEIAKENAATSNLPNIKFRVADVLSETWPRKHTKRFHLIVSNPPYVTLDDFHSLDPELRLFEPRVALTDGSDGLSFYRRIAELTPRLLIKGKGRLLLEIGHGQLDAITEILRSHGLVILRIVNDLAEIPRVIVAKR